MRATTALAAGPALALAVAALAPAARGCGSDYIDGHGRRLAGWSYADEDSQDHWGEHFPDCALKEQSPVNLPSLSQVALQGKEAEHGLESLFTNYMPTEATFTNNGHTVQVNFPSGSQFLEPNHLANKVGRSKDKENSYELAQFHFHWGATADKGSEHTVGEQAFPLEAHLVHFNTKYASLNEAATEADGLLVVGFFFQVGEEEHPILANLTHLMADLEVDTTVPVSVDPGVFFENADLGDYYLYRGSLTTPGCFQSVTWVVHQQTQTLTADQLAAFHDSHMHEAANYRHTQSLNGRNVYLRNMVFSQASVDAEPAEEESNGFETATYALVAVVIILIIALAVIASKKITKTANAAQRATAAAASIRRSALQMAKPAPAAGVEPETTGTAAAVNTAMAKV